MASFGITDQVIERIDYFDKQAKSNFLDKFSVKQNTLLSKLVGVIEEVQSDGPAERLPFMGSSPMVTEYNEGNVPIGGFGAYLESVTNKTFGLAIPIGREYFEDMGRMPGAKDMMLRKVGDGLANRAMNYWTKRLAEFLKGTGDYSAYTGWDGKAYYAADHTGGTNLYAGGTSYSVPTLRSEHENVMKTYTDMTDAEGHDIIREEAPSHIVYLVPVERLTAYKTMFHAQIVPADAIATGGTTDYVGSVQSNVYSPEVATGEDTWGNKVTVIGWSRLNGYAGVFTFDVTDAVDGPRAVFHQIRVAPELEYLGPTESNPVWVLGEKALWKVRMRGNLHGGDFQKTVKVTKS